MPGQVGAADWFEASGQLDGCNRSGEEHDVFCDLRKRAEFAKDDRARRGKGEHLLALPPLRYADGCDNHESDVPWLNRSAADDDVVNPQGLSKDEIQSSE